MKNFHTRKTSNGSNFGWLIRQTSINQKSGRQTSTDVSLKDCIRLSFRFAMPAGMLFTKRNENRAWSQVTVDASSAEPFSSPEPVVRLNIKPSGSGNKNAAEPEGRRHRDCAWKASGTQGICPYALLLFSVSPWLSWPGWGAGRARVWRKVGPARRPRRLMTLPSQQGDPPSPTFCFSRERLVRFLKDMWEKLTRPE